jgi:hypothetical protein
MATENILAIALITFVCGWILFGIAKFAVLGHRYGLSYRAPGWLVWLISGERKIQPAAGETGNDH